MFRTLFVALAIVLPAAARADCSPELLASFQAEVNTAGMLFVPLTVDGRTVSAMICTSCAWSSLGEGFVDNAGIRKRTARVRYTSPDGNYPEFIAEPVSVKLGNVALKDDFMVDAGTGDDATIGLNLLEYFDFEIDNAAKVVSFYRHSRCGRPSAEWARNAAELRFDTRSEHIDAVVDLNGKELKAGLYTGVPSTMMELTIAGHHFGVTPQTPGVSKTGTLQFDGGDKTFDTYSYTLPELTISGLRFRHVPVKLIDLDGYGINLGMHELRQLHFFVAFANKRIYVTQIQSR